MGLKDLLRRWSKSEDERALAQTQDKLDREDYEAQKDDVELGQDFAAAEAREAADDDLHAG
jgi:hypothetical protein